jgi:molybdopterin-guanine dinucleotide biosynthesis protein A
MNKSVINAIVLAGGREDLEGNVHGYKSLLALNGRPMIDYVVEALKNTPDVGEIAVVGPVDELSPYISDKVDYIISEGDSMMDNVIFGLRPFQNDDRVLFLSSDIPFITPDAISHFIKQSCLTDADFCYPIVERSVNEAKFSGFKRTYVRLKEGAFTGGNIMYVKPSLVTNHKELIEDLIAMRKEPINMIELFGAGLAIDLAIGRASIEAIEKRIEQMLNIKAKAIISPYPEISQDIDKNDDIKAALRIFEGA